ncbi:MAG: DNA polymerase III subunit gamma/tau, partial [Gammaproteobacteria bacterium]|nr:DNA polymerase III subunit gamma/tau [Gammaproteobacteria bacterium]
DTQLFYQIGLIGQRDLPLAPDPRSGFEMVLLRMLAFQPVRTEASKPPVAEAQQVGSTQQADACSTSQRNAPVPAPAAPKIAESPTRVDLSQWHQVVAALQLGGIARQLANNCLFEAWEGGLLKLRLDNGHRQLRVSSAEQRLCRALESFTGAPLRLEIRIDDLSRHSAETPAQTQAKAQQARQRTAEQEIENDPLVLAMKERFAARIIPGSVRAADE